MGAGYVQKETRHTALFSALASSAGDVGFQSQGDPQGSTIPALPTAQERGSCPILSALGAPLLVKRGYAIAVFKEFFLQWHQKPLLST